MQSSGGKSHEVVAVTQEDSAIFPVDVRCSAWRHRWEGTLALAQLDSSLKAAIYQLWDPGDEWMFTESQFPPSRNSV